MHIMEGFLPFKHALAGTVASAPFLAVGTGPTASPVSRLTFPPAGRNAPKARRMLP